ncbi:MAG: transposase [Betaproteobacteria bacterium]|nr:transposase [Betaproteobacteria bacterium]
MARRPRLRIAGVPQHVIQRGNNRQATFFADEDYVFYLECLREAAIKHECAIHAYVLMTNHVHLLTTSGQPETMSLVMRDLGRRYVQHINFVYQRSGTAWEGRFKASLVDTETYFLRCCRYIECNPVRARMVAHPADYRWSSYRFHAEGAPDRLLSTHEQYQRLGFTADERQRAYRELFRSELDSDELSEIRGAANRGWPLGSDRFKDQIEAALRRVARPPKRGRPSHQAHTPPD